MFRDSNKAKVLFRAPVAASLAVVLGFSSTSISVAASTQAGRAVQAGGESINASYNNLSSADWREIASRAAASGDSKSADAALALARITRPVTGKEPAPNIISTVAKRAVIAALRYGSDKLPEKIRPYSNKILYFLEDLENWQEGAIATGLMHLGIPMDVAQAAAKWIVVFAGV